MEIFIITLLVIILFVLWLISTRKRLRVMNENAENAMGQIGVQLASRFELLFEALDIAKCFAGCEISSLLTSLEREKNDITARSMPEDVLNQEKVIVGAMKYLSEVEERYPEMKRDDNYIKCIDAANSYKKMILTSCLIYNDTVERYNKVLEMLSIRLIAGMLGFHRRKYLKLRNE